MLDLLEEPMVEEFRATLNIVIMVWNVHGLSMTTAGGRRVYLEELEEPHRGLGMRCPLMRRRNSEGKGGS